MNHPAYRDSTYWFFLLLILLTVVAYYPGLAGDYLFDDTVNLLQNKALDIETLDTYVRSTYPDLRKCLNLCQMNSADGKLTNVKGDEGGSADWRVDAVNLFKAGKIVEARKLMCSTVRPEEMEDVFRWMYDNLELFSTTQEGQDSAIMAIRTGLVNHSFVADPEINLSATMVELSQIN